MSLSKIIARRGNGSENKIDVGTNNVISESSSDSEYSSFNEVHEAFVEITNFDEENEIPPFAVRMMNLGKELAIFCLLMITYAALTKDPPKVSKPPAAYPFFPENSIATDWYRGQISTAIEIARFSDVTFIMYYAPWDAESQAARKEFEEAGKYLKKYITFAAVNCWHPNSECRQQYNKVYKWPVFIAYPSHSRGIQYNGPINAAHLIRFLQKVSNPVKRLTNEKPIDFEDVYVVASLNTQPGNTDYIIYYVAALKYLERDPQHRITFYLNSTSHAETRLMFYLWNETLIFPIHEKPWTSEEILKWMYKNIHQVSSWVLPNASKSLALSKSINNEPVLILFTPRNPLQPTSDHYSLLQEIGQEYYNCDNVQLNPESISIKFKRAANLLRYNNLMLNCKQKSRSHRLNWKMDYIWSNTSTFLNVEQNCLLGGGKGFGYPCPDIHHNLKVKKLCNSKRPEVFTTSMLTGHNDPRSAENLLITSQKEICRQFLYAEKYYPMSFAKSPQKNNLGISGYACKSNKTLTFLAMDSLLHYPYAEKLGVNLSIYEDKTAAIIIDDQMESHYVLEGPVNELSLKEFVLNFTDDKLSRSFKSVSNVRPEINTKIQNKRNNKSDEIFVEELNTETFLPTIYTENKAVVVFFYSKQCAFCSGFSYIFLTLARKLRFVENILFTRIDGEENILPWEYTMETYPTIILFPAKRKSESRVFQSNVPITLSNLLGFLLTNIDPHLKIASIWSLCLQMKTKEEPSCYFSLLKETLVQIDRNLKEWRKANDIQKSKHLYNLRQLRQLHLVFAHHPHNYRLITSSFEKFRTKFNFSTYHRLNVDEKIRDEL